MRPVICPLGSRRASHSADTVSRPERRSVCPNPPASSSLDPRCHPLRLGRLCLGGDFAPARPDRTPGSFRSGETFLP